MSKVDFGGLIASARSDRQAAFVLNEFHQYSIDLQFGDHQDRLIDNLQAYGMSALVSLFVELLAACVLLKLSEKHSVVPAF